MGAPVGVALALLVEGRRGMGLFSGMQQMGSPVGRRLGASLGLQGEGMRGKDPSLGGVVSVQVEGRREIIPFWD